MNRLVVGLLFAVLTVGGLVGIASPTATADPYPGTVQTHVVIKAKKKVAVGRRGKVKVSVTASGNARPTGTVRVVVRRIGGGYKLRLNVSYNGGTVKVKTSRLKKAGRYKVKVKYLPPAGSVFTKSKGQGVFKVKRKRNR